MEDSRGQITSFIWAIVWADGYRHVKFFRKIILHNTLESQSQNQLAIMR